MYMDKEGLRWTINDNDWHRWTKKNTDKKRKTQMDTLALKHATLKRFWLILIAALWFSNQPFIIQNQLILIFI